MSYTMERTVAQTRLDYDGRNFLLYHPTYNADWIRDLAAGTYDKKCNCWVIPGYVLYAHVIAENVHPLELSPAALSALSMPDLKPSLRLPTVGPLGKIFNQDFYAYQREAVTWLVRGPKRTGLAALSPGLGKTVVALVAARILGLEKVLIVAPKSLLRTWENEEQKWFGTATLERRHGQAPELPFSGWILANYDTVVGRHHPAYCAVDWDLVVLDESVLVKNRRTQRFKKLLELRKRLKPNARWWELSGSPTTRYADDLWAQLHLQDPKGFSSYWRFAQRFTYVTQDVWGTQITGTRQNVDIIGDLKDVMFVRSQKDVLAELPEEIPMLVEVDLNPKQAKAYVEMVNDFVVKLESGTEVKAAIVLSQLIRLQQITSNLCNIGGEDDSAKADALVEMLEARSFALPALIWTNWKPGAYALWQRLSLVAARSGDQLRIEYVCGDFKAADNEEKFEAYKAGNLEILIVSMPLGKFGHNLQMTRTSIYMDKTWFADDYVQSMKRVKRIGLDHRPLVITLKATGTVDQLVEDNLSGKFQGIAAVSNEDLASMLRHLRGGQT